MIGEFGKAEKVHQAETMQKGMAGHDAQETERLPPDPNDKWQFSEATGVRGSREYLPGVTFLVERRPQLS